MAAELVLDIHADDLLEVSLGTETERDCPSWVKIARPPRHDPRDHFIRLPADEPNGFHAADVGERRDLIRDGRRDARHRHAAAVAERSAVDPRRVHEELSSGTGRSKP